ncbi:MAG TPA: M23 family metallopeptidase, partial [Gaiellales bacterium]|nr:M23 family metallopeptidase [Gaiellales bacterium]
LALVAHHAAHPMFRTAFNSPLTGPCVDKSFQSTHFHTGIDIANVLDTPVVAAAPGRVILATSSRDAAGNLVGYGNYVVIDHGGGYLTLYGHLDKFVVTAGQLVQRGQEIGLLGSTGWSTGPHLHFEIRHDGDYVNPEPLLGAAVRP